MAKSIIIQSERRSKKQLLEFKRLRKLAIENGINVQDIIENEVEIPEITTIPIKINEKGFETRKPAPVNETKRKPKITASTKLVRNALSVIRKRGKTTTLDEIVNEVKEGLSGETGFNCPLKGWVSRELYGIAEKIRKVRTATKNTGMVNPQNLGEILKIPINNSDAKHIVGILNEKYIRDNYQFNDRELTFANEEDVKYNIEGLISWDSEEKEIARQLLAGYVQEDLLSPLYDRKNEIREEKELITEELANARKKVPAGFTLHGAPEVLNYLNNNSPEFRELKGIHGAKLYRRKANIWEITWTDKNSEAEVREAIGVIEKTNPNRRLKIKELKIKKGHDGKKRKKELKERKRNLTTEETELRTKNTITYLGLEGPSFGSYFQLSSLFELSDNQDLEFRAIIPEKGYRESNLMNSMVETYKGDDKLNGLFNNVEIVCQRNIDDLILLDFVKNQEISLNWRKTPEKSSVRFREERISFDDYHRLIDNLDRGIPDHRLTDIYQVSKEFLEATRDRYDGKLDIVFLDYLCGENEKRYSVIERLIPKLSDNSVLAITTNKEKTVHFDKKNPQWFRLMEMEGINIEKHDNKSYKSHGSKGNGMELDVYHIRKQNE